MRAVFVNLLIIQLLFQGVVVSHFHSRDIHLDQAEHATRPHVHLSGHRHPHSLRPHHHSSQSGSPAVPPQSPPAHDEDAVYLSNVVLMASGEPEQVPELARLGWTCASVGLLGTPVISTAVSGMNSGPPVEQARTALKLLPHLLRI